jgi:hypothetical protein
MSDFVFTQVREMENEKQMRNQERTNKRMLNVRKQ